MREAHRGVVTVASAVLVSLFFLYLFSPRPNHANGQERTENGIVQLSEAHNNEIDRLLFPAPPPVPWEEAIEEQIEETPALLQTGREIFERVCAQCHGIKGDGTGESAQFMITKPRDYTRGIFKFRTTPEGSPPSDHDLFRTITTGFSQYGMPSFRHFSVQERWALVYYVKQLAQFNEAYREDPIPFPEDSVDPEDLGQISDSIARGKLVYEKIECFQCHGEQGRGDGPSADTLTDAWGNKTYPLDITRGKTFFKGGGRPRDIVRILALGIDGTPMPSFADIFESPEEAWDLARYVADLAEKGEARKRREWRNLFVALRGSFSLEGARQDPPEENWDPEISEQFASVPPEVAREKGCLSCHQGIEDINDEMMPHLVAFGGGVEGRSCAVCHGGNPDGTTKQEAHLGIFPNPSSMWVISFGQGCAKCHTGRDTLKSVHGTDFPHAVGGGLMDVVSFASDPSGLTGSNHVYRMQRGLMATEFGKATHTLTSNGIVPKGDYIYSAFALKDTDGGVPSVGTDVYKEWIAKALEADAIERVDEAKQIPAFDEALELWKDPVKAAFSDYYRKECSRCHIWVEGRRGRGDRRAGGCAACHVPYTNEGFYEGGDPTIPKEKAVHPFKHEITVKIPVAQCTHCHARGSRIGTNYAGATEFDYVADGKATPYDEDGNPQEQLFSKEYLPVREDVHHERGLTCIDCHTSVEMHGDGNIYPSIPFQVETNCADCHGTPTEYPWELPVGYGGKVELPGSRGTFDKDEVQYLLTSRGNVRGNAVRKGDKAILTGKVSGKEHEIPLLKEKNLHDNWKTEQGKVAMAVVSQHIDKLECFACHAVWAPQCFGCHTKYDRREFSTDWVLSSLNHDPDTGKQQIVKTRGKVTVENRSFTRWEDPILGVNTKGRVSPIIPGCQVFFTYVDQDGTVVTINRHYQTSDGFNSITMAPLQPHTNSIPARTCESCHTNPKTIGYGTGNSRSQGLLNGGEPFFGDMSKGYNPGLPGAKTERQQVPGIPEFPFALDQLVTRDGFQTQNMPHLEDRPLNERQRNLVEREGTCVACHKHYNTPFWEEVRKKVGSALTPEDHDRVVEAALKALVGQFTLDEEDGLEGTQKAEGLDDTQTRAGHYSLDPPTETR